MAFVPQISEDQINKWLSKAIDPHDPLKNRSWNNMALSREALLKAAQEGAEQMFDAVVEEIRYREWFAEPRFRIAQLEKLCSEEHRIRILLSRIDREFMSDSEGDAALLRYRSLLSEARELVAQLLNKEDGE